MKQHDQEVQIRKYVKSFKQDYSPDELEAALLKAGYDKVLVEKALHQIPSQPTKISTFLDRHFSDPLHFSKWYAAIGIIILVLLGIATAAFLAMPTNCGYDKLCFDEYAVQGKRVTVKEDFAGSTLKYTYKNDVITKEFIDFDPNEPAEVVNLLEGKTMECPVLVYDEEFASGLFGMIDFCEGELKEIVYDIEIMQG